MEKSDALIVPAKRANNAGVSAAECAEGSGAKERNVELQSMVRTQSRAAVSHAQGCIREVVSNASRHTRLKSRMREFRQSGSVRGAVSNDRPYRDLISSAKIYGQESRTNWGFDSMFSIHISNTKATSSLPD